MDKFIHALLIDRNGFQKIIPTRFEPIVRVADRKRISVIPHDGKTPSAPTTEVREFFFDKWDIKEELGIWREI